ncbi:(d)CMP kinase [Vulcanisaeta sp. JCM 14467]|uniref:(d)CMP kinase n=1 Tax=Vulcanisaeta sp. JCM 14467 TaxID=1295370 RepID=UPI0006D11DE7|nr:AAA family ATPase [Vulcanisaeta sp. JCM 14467]
MGVIAISGQAASGKTTVARELANRLNYRFVSVGELFRRIAIQRGVSLLELHRIAETDFSIDRAVDEEAIKEARRGNVVIEGHLAAWMLRDVADVRIYLKADINVRSQRLSSRDGKSIEEALNEIRLREKSNRRRYLTIYGIDINDISFFDLVIDTTYIDAEKVVDIIYEYVSSVLRNKGRF